MTTENSDTVNPNQVANETELLRRGLVAASERKAALQLELDARTKQKDQVIADYTALMNRHQELKSRHDTLASMVQAKPVPVNAYVPQPALIHIDHSGHVNFAIRWATMVAVILVAAVVFCAINPGNILNHKESSNAQDRSAR